MSTELMQNQFKPINEKGQNPVTSGGEVLAYTYTPNNSPDNLTADFIVAKVNAKQFILGPKHAIIQVAKAFNILDSLGLGRLRHMNIIVNPYINALKSSDSVAKGERFIREVCKQFNLHENLRGSSFDQNITASGICPDVKEPVYTSGDISKWKGWEELITDFELTAILYVGRLRHEWVHVEQVRQGLPVNSLWAERCAMSYQSTILLKILNSNTLKKSQQETLVSYLRSRTRTIYNYRNGRGFENHLDKENSNVDGSPTCIQTLHLDDFCFGH